MDDQMKACGPTRAIAVLRSAVRLMYRLLNLNCSPSLAFTCIHPVCPQNAACTSHDVPVPEELHQGCQWVFHSSASHPSLPVAFRAPAWDWLSCSLRLFEMAAISYSAAALLIKAEIPVFVSSPVQMPFMNGPGSVGSLDGPPCWDSRTPSNRRPACSASFHVVCVIHAAP